jgi:hypothetical protein
MHTRTLKKLALALTFWLALHASALKAQIFTNDLPLQADTTGTNPVDFEFRSDATTISRGNLGVGSLESGDQGDGTRMLWFPSLSAFRVGTVSTGLSLGSGPWDTANIGEYSTAIGYNAEASGEASMALGAHNVASALHAVALGSHSTASGYDSAAMGSYATSAGSYSTAMGLSTTASGYDSTAMGMLTLSYGSCSTASGMYTTAASCFDFVVGVYNVGGGNETDWIGTDPLFEVGNGGGSSPYANPAFTAPADAFVVYKSGDAAVQGNLAAGGVITAAPGGDIPMYSGN